MTTDVIETEYGGDWLEPIGSRWGHLQAGDDDALPDTAAQAAAITRSASTTLGAARPAVDVGRQVRQDMQDDLAAEQAELGGNPDDPGVRAWYAKHDQLAQITGDHWAWAEHLAAGNERDAVIMAEMKQHKLSLGLPETASSAEIRARVAEVSAHNLEAENRALRAGRGAGAGGKNAKPRVVAIPTDPGAINRAFREAVENDDRAAIARLSGAVERLSRSGGGWTTAADGAVEGWVS